MDIREILLRVATQGVRVGSSTARVTDIQLREGAPPYVRVPAGYVLIDNVIITRLMVAQLFAWLVDPPRRPAPGRAGSPAEGEPDGAGGSADPASGEPSPPAPGAPGIRSGSGRTPPGFPWEAALDASPSQSIVRACTLANEFRLRATLFRHGEPAANGEEPLAASVRVLPAVIPSMERLGLHSFLRDWVRASGLILVTGATGMGKSTTIAGLLNYVNTDTRFGSRNIITLESPIEYRLPSNLSIVTQRAVGEGEHSVRDFESGIQAALRQRPDILMIGEILSRDAAAAALRAATSGHTVVATVHGASAVGALSSMLSMFGAGEVPDRARELARALIGVTYQRLVPSQDESRLVLAAEQLTGSEPVRRMIETLKFQELDQEMKSRTSRTMWSLEADLANLLKRRQISLEWARAMANDSEHLERMLRAHNLASGDPGK